MTNKRGKGGFGDNPQNRNNKGRPKKGYSITEQFRKMLSSNPKVRETIAKSILQKALQGDLAAQKLIWNYMDGMPVQGVEHAGVDGNEIKIVIEDYGDKNNLTTETASSDQDE